jgi:sialate O-acetylesterase
MKVLSKLSAAFCIAWVGLACLGAIAQADVKLHPLFTDNMILQRDKPVSVWGTADPGEKISVALFPQAESSTLTSSISPLFQTVADVNGEWSVKLKPLQVNATPLEISVNGKNQIRIHNVAVGDVYICSGQSNMEMGIGLVNNAKEEIAAANYPNIRLLMVPHQVSGSPQKTFSAPVSWKVCTPENVAQGGWGGFSAAGYFFGRELHQRLKIPIGLIESSWGGTIAQAWTSRSTLLKRDDLRDATLQTEQAFQAVTPFAQRQAAWWQANDTGTKSGWNGTFDDSGWKTMKPTGSWEANGLPNFDGLVWFRKTVEIPAAWAGKELQLSLGPIDDRDTTFFNGVAIGGMDVWNEPRVYKVPANLVKAGPAVIAVRVLDTGGGGGFVGNENPSLCVASDAAQKIDLGSDWRYAVSRELKDLPAPPAESNGNPNQPTVLFNGMIAPLVSFAVRGAIWYQGESNAGNPTQYRTLFPDLIRDWRTVWNAKQDGSEFGFYFVQLANFMARVDDPVQGGWAELREAQTMALKVPRTGMATIIDVGDAGDIHPRNKQDVGKRLALAALATEYNQQLEFSGPMFYMMELEAGSNRIRIHFTHALGIKTSDGKAPRGFAVQAEDGTWKKADARIEGETVVVWNDGVLRPKAVRYAWANNPDVNLVNADGLPDVPFRTDLP